MLLPHPLGPTRASVCPGLSETLSPFKTCTSGRDGYWNVTFSIVMAAFNLSCDYIVCECEEGMDADDTSIKEHTGLAPSSET